MHCEQRVEKKVSISNSGNIEQNIMAFEENNATFWTWSLISLRRPVGVFFQVILGKKSFRKGKNMNRAWKQRITYFNFQCKAGDPLWTMEQFHALKIEFSWDCLNLDMSDGLFKPPPRRDKQLLHLE